MNIEIDWMTFLNTVLDGGFSLDISKTGSLTMFVKNQLGIGNNYESNVGKFEIALQTKMETMPLDITSVLTKTEVYLKLINLGAAFLPFNREFNIKCASLYIQLIDFHRRLSVTTLENLKTILSATSSVLVSFIEHYKTVYEQVGIIEIYERHPFLKVIAEKWNSLISAESLLDNPNILIGAIYLGEWKVLSPQKKEIFFKANKVNPTLFTAIINDMSRIEGKGFYNYHDFVNDCSIYFKRFHEAVLRRSDFWFKKITSTESKTGKVEVLRANYNRFFYENENNNLLSGDELRLLVKNTGKL